MPRAFAEFIERTVDGEVVKCRHDTRLYFAHQERFGQSRGQCLGAFYLQNPGSATPTRAPKKSRHGFREWPWAPLCPDPLMKVLFSLIDRTLDHIEQKKPNLARKLRNNSYIRLLNLSYVCDAVDSKSAMKQWQAVLKAGEDNDEEINFLSDIRFVALGWGAAFRDKIDGERVSRVLVATRRRLPLVIPFLDKKTSQLNIKIEKLDNDVEEVRKQVNLPNSYPSRTKDYAATVAVNLSKILLKAK